MTLQKEFQSLGLKPVPGMSSPVSATGSPTNARVETILHRAHDMLQATNYVRTCFTLYSRVDGTASSEMEQPHEGVLAKVSEMVNSCWRAPSSGGLAEVKVALHVLFIDDYLAFCISSVIGWFDLHDSCYCSSTTIVSLQSICYKKHLRAT